MPRRFIDAPDALRCKASILLRDKSGAQCGRHAKVDGLCVQHARIAERCVSCGKLPAIRGGLCHRCVHGPHVVEGV